MHAGLQRVMMTVTKSRQANIKAILHLTFKFLCNVYKFSVFVTFRFFTF